MRLLLQVVANIELRVVADAVVDPRQPLPGILVECDLFDVVVTTGGIRIGVRKRQNTNAQHVLSALVDKACGEDAANWS